MKLIIPFPPSVNNLFRNVAGRGRVPSARYQTWKVVADEEVMLQKKQYFKGPVHVLLTVEDRGNQDADNCAKAPLDLLVRHGIIEDDNRKIVRKLTVQWGDVKGCEILVEAA